VQRRNDDNIPEEIPHNGLDDIPADKDVDVLVADVAEGDRASKLVDETDAVDNDTRGGQTLGAHSGLEGLGRDDTLEGRVGEGIEDVEEEIRC